MSIFNLKKNRSILLKEKLLKDKERFKYESIIEEYKNKITTLKNCLFIDILNNNNIMFIGIRDSNIINLYLLYINNNNNFNLLKILKLQNVSIDDKISIYINENYNNEIYVIIKNGNKMCSIKHYYSINKINNEKKIIQLSEIDKSNIKYKECNNLYIETDKNNAEVLFY